MKRSCNGTVNGKERLGTLEPKHNNAYEPIVENVHDTFTKRTCSRKKNAISSVEFRQNILRFWKKLLFLSI